MGTSLVYYMYRFITWYKKPKEKKAETFFEDATSAYYEEFVEEYDAEAAAEGEQPEIRIFNAFSWHKVSCTPARAASSATLLFRGA